VTTSGVTNFRGTSDSEAPISAWGPRLGPSLHGDGRPLLCLGGLCPYNLTDCGNSNILRCTLPWFVFSNGLFSSSSG